MKQEEPVKPQGFLLDTIAYVSFLTLAFLLKWKTADLVWSLWLGSLVIGYLTILSNISAGVYVTHFLSTYTPKGKAVILGGGLIGALFLLAFFTVHFGMFHLIHGIFLSSFFPIEALQEGIMDPIILLKKVFTVILPQYGAFLLPAFITQRYDIGKAWMLAHSFIRQIKEGKSVEDPFKNKNTGSFMTAPYLNVVRMHLLIFFFAAVAALKVENFFVYAIVYTVYFFPWRLLFAKNTPSNTISRKKRSA